MDEGIVSPSAHLRRALAAGLERENVKEDGQMVRDSGVKQFRFIWTEHDHGQSLKAEEKFDRSEGLR